MVSKAIHTHHNTAHFDKLTNIEHVCLPLHMSFEFGMSPWRHIHHAYTRVYTQLYMCVYIYIYIHVDNMYYSVFIRGWRSHYIHECVHHFIH